MEGMGVPRFLLPDVVLGEVELDSEQSHHAFRVLRMREGDEAVVFDGRGWEGVARIRRVQGRVRLQVMDRKRSQRELPFSVTAAVSAPKGKRLDWLVQKLTELGVAEIVLVRFERSVVVPRPAKIARLRSIAEEAARQSGRGSVPQIRSSQACELEGRIRGSLLFGKPEAERSVRQARPGTETTFVVGPEGGFTREEEELLARKGVAVSLGPTILRVETAAIAFAAALAQIAVELGAEPTSG